MAFESPAPLNPYAPVTTEAPLHNPISQAAEIRRKYLNHEASVKSIGILYLLGAIFLIPAGLFVIGLSIHAMATNSAEIKSPAVLLVIGAFELAFGFLQGMTGLAIRQFKQWARVVGIIFSAIGLLGFPLGTLISAYFLYLLTSAKGVYVFSDEYQQVIAATPEIKYKTSIVVWILLALLLGLIGLGLIAAVVGTFA